MLRSACAGRALRVGFDCRGGMSVCVLETREAMAMATQRVFPPMPEIGRPETFYAKMVHRADKTGDTFGHEAYKVGQYVTLAMAPNLTWEQKLKYLTHALKRHCQPPPFPDDEVWMFYRQLADLVRQYAGQEAVALPPPPGEQL